MPFECVEQRVEDDVTNRLFAAMDLGRRSGIHFGIGNDFTEFILIEGNTNQDGVTGVVVRLGNFFNFDHLARQTV